MSYKCLHDNLEESDRHAALSDFGCRVWMLALAKSDCRGRITADAEWLAGHLGYKPFDAKRVAEALEEIGRVGLAHFYEARGKRFMVFHKAEQSCGTGMGRKTKAKHPTPPQGLCECCSGSFQQSDASAAGSATCSAISSPLLSVPNPPPPAGESTGSRETPEEPPAASDSDRPTAHFSTDREAMHLAQRWRGVNGRDSRALSSLEKASQAFAMTIRAGVDPHSLEAAIVANPGRSPLEIRDLVLPRAGPARASPPAVTGERKTVRWTPPLPEPEVTRGNADSAASH